MLNLLVKYDRADDMSTLLNSPPTIASPASEEVLDLVFGALSHRARRAMLRRLSVSPATVSELAQPFDMSLPAISKHLGVLEKAGLVDREKDGRVRRCTMNPAPLGEAEQWVAERREMWERAFARLDQLLEVKP